MAENRIIRVGILADSLGLPRNVDNERVTVSMTYPDQVRRKLNSLSINNVVYTDARRARKMPDALHIWENYLSLYELSHLAIQIGVVDAAPRIFSFRENKFLDGVRPKFLRNWIIRMAGRNRKFLVKFRKKVYTKISEFERTARALVHSATDIGVHFAFVGIFHTTKLLEERSPGFNHNVDKYNSVLEEIARTAGGKFIDPNSNAPTDSLLSDGIHLGDHGANHVSDLVVDWLKNE